MVISHSCVSLPEGKHTKSPIPCCSVSPSLPPPAALAVRPPTPQVGRRPLKPWDFRGDSMGITVTSMGLMVISDDAHRI